MFENIDEKSVLPTTAAEDIFGDMENTGSTRSAPPSVPVPPTLEPPIRVAPTLPPLPRPIKRAGGGKRVLIIVGVAILVLGGVGGAYWWLTRPASPVVEPVKPPQPQPELSPVPLPVPTPEPTPEVVDSDSDGLPDTEELSLGTNPQNIDSDSDGLFDRDEVRVYQTDPLNPDTDGDTFSDGTEVQNGYNPKGQGKLLELPSS